ncbi:MAG TPA: right-handed parallel beta-helix repeat-containing protein [Thermoanaerobaculia bacterium]|jgi:hypothetical protein|nr:right-handed parallel beta-helix repeat-containing protein [Thermoanaerobaculia bacterium]
MSRRFILHLTILAVVVLMTVGVSAQATRTWVSGVGDDVNPCSRTAPCKTFAGAISKTAAGGEISVLDPGGYGTLTITKSITVDGKGQIASALNSSISGMTVNGAGITVTLRNLEINGAGTTPGLRGVRVLNARQVNLENLFIFGQRGNPGRGVDVNLTAPVTTTITMNNVTISDVASHAVAVQAVSGVPTVRMHIANSFFKDNGNGNGDGLFVGDGATVMVSKTQINGFTAAGVETFGNGQVQLDDCVISHSTRGVFAAGTSVIRLSRNTIVNNATNGISATAPAQIQTYGDNYFANNGANVGVLTSIAAQKQ